MVRQGVKFCSGRGLSTILSNAEITTPWMKRKNFVCYYNRISIGKVSFSDVRDGRVQKRDTNEISTDPGP